MTSQAPDLALVACVVASAATCITAHYVERPRLLWVTKPLTMVFVLALAARGSGGGLYQGLVLAGLVFSLAGDVFLMLPSDRFFEGLASFFVGHVFYICAFASGSDAALTREPLVLVGLLAAGGSVVVWLWPTLGRFKRPVVVYVVAIVAMAWQATARFLESGDPAAGLACAGALLFVVSDSALAVNRFRLPFRAADAVVLGTYFAAQLLIASSIQGPAAA
jgi:uncharacterized membrane protein YhhN